MKDMVSTVDVKTKVKSNSFNLNMIAAAATMAIAALSPAGSAAAKVTLGDATLGASSISHQHLSQNMHQVVHEPSTIYANKFILRAGDAHITDSQIRAKLVDAIIRKDLIIESIADEFCSETNGGGFSQSLAFLSLASGIRNIAEEAAKQMAAADVADAALRGHSFSITDAGEIDKRINAFAALVGEEQFNLVVGGTLLSRSAFYGKKAAGEAISGPRTQKPSEQAPIAGEKIEAGKIVHEVVPEEHSSWNDSYTIPLGDLIDAVSALTPTEQVSQAVYESAKAEGKSDAEATKESKEAAKEAQKFFDDPKTKEIAEESQSLAQEMRVTNRKKQAAQQKIKTLLEKNPELRDKATADALIARAEKGEKVEIPQIRGRFGSSPETFQKHEQQRQAALREQRQLDNALALANARRDLEEQEAAFKAQENQSMKLMTEANGKVNAFMEKHPTMAKYGKELMNVVCGAAIAGAFAGAALAAPETGGASLAAGGEIFNQIVENGSEAFVKYCAAQGRTEAEAAEYANAAAEVVQKALTIGAIRGGVKALGGKFKHKARILSKTEAAALAKEAFKSKSLANENKVRREANLFGIVDDKANVGDVTVTSFVRDAPGSMNTALRQRTALAFQEAGILNSKYELTPKAVRESEMLSLVTKKNPDGKIGNDKIIGILTNDGSSIKDWHKYSTKSVDMHTGESRQIHFYMNDKTGKIDYETIDFKVKSDVVLDPKLRSQANKK